MQEKYYTRSNGEKVKLSEMNSEHLINSMNKCFKEIFNSNDVEDYNNKLNTLNDLKNEYYNRLGKFYTDKFEKGEK